MTGADHLCGSVMQCGTESFKLNLVFGPWLSHMSRLKSTSNCSRTERSHFLQGAFTNCFRSSQVSQRGRKTPSAVRGGGERERSELGGE